MSEFIGFKEKWVERGWTRKQMRDRIEELGLTVDSWCVLQPYELNFMQNPNANQEIEEDVESGERAIASKNLWKPGETITIQCNKTSLVDNFESTIKKYVMQDVQPYVSMKFKFVDQSEGGRIIVALFKKIEDKDGDPIGGGSAIGKKGERQVLSVSLNNFEKKDSKFNWQRYTIVHEFGHVLGLNHEFEQNLCKQSGITCTGPDPLSVMGYPTKNSSKTMDHFSPGDIAWLKKVYA
jgi:hypothetical protein